MKRIAIYALTALMSIFPPAAAFAVSIVPAPCHFVENRSSVYLPNTISVYPGNSELKETAKIYMSSLAREYAPGTTDAAEGLKRIVSDVTLPAMKLTGNESKAVLRLYTDPSLADEEYTMTISVDDGVLIKGGSAKGVWWGLQTFTQILVQSASAAPAGEPLRVSGLSIQDKPHFSYRGAMLDCCRHFFSVDEVKKFIDMLALHKINTFHWHLTDDQGWRIEIKKYPLLTEIGSVRKETLVGHYGSDKYDGTPYGGYYTQKDIKEIVKYASDRYISVIPEIEMPGHAVAALASYPWLGCTGEGYEVRTTWGISDDVFCLGKETTYEFLQNVLDEVCGLFPGEYIHIGGDEAPHLRWDECPVCSQKMKQEGLTQSRQLQGYMLKRIEKYINSKGKKIIGWDEILDGGVTPTATVMSWRGAKGGIKAAKQGNNVVMSPNSHFYLDYYQTANPEASGEPLGIGGHLPLRTCYSFDPYDQLDENTKKHIVGIQANTWTEYIGTFDHIQHMDLPRFTALSEVAWSENKTSYDDFLARVSASMVPVYEYFGYVYAPYAFEGIE